MIYWGKKHPWKLVSIPTTDKGFKESRCDPYMDERIQTARVLRKGALLKLMLRQQV